jgi:ATP-dependent DNA ligase
VPRSSPPPAAPTWSRQQRPLTPAFPDVVEAIASQLPAGTVIDGELVVMSKSRLDFLGLQRRLTSRRVLSGAPATLVAFDIVADRDEDLRALPHAQRRERLEQLIDRSGTGLALMPATRDLAGARAWMTNATDGIEGVVTKRADQSYRPRVRWWAKTRAKDSAEAVVGGVVGPPSAPTALILGRYDTHGRLRIIGRTFPLRREARAELALLLTEPTGPHPWPTVLPGGRIGLPGSDPVEHTPVAPTLVVEIEVDRVFEAGRYRHGVKFVRTRLDLLPSDIALA